MQITDVSDQNSCLQEKEKAEKSEDKKLSEPSKVPFHHNLKANSIVVNLSSAKLTEDEKSVLEKGLNFAITEENIDKEKLLDDTYRASRKLKLKAFFDTTNKKTQKKQNKENEQEKDDSVCDRAETKSRINNPYYNPSKTPPKAVDLYIAAIKNSIKKMFRKDIKVKDNLTEDQRKGLTSLKDRDDIVIQTADKGKKIVIMNKAEYINSIEEMLNDEEFYKKEESDKSEEFCNRIRDSINELDEKDFITTKESQFLKNDLAQPRIPVFYGLPKIHKLFEVMPPMRPIVSGYKSCTAALSEFLDSFLKHRAQKCKSYIKDTNDFLLKIASLKNLPSHTILVTMDVTSLYTNIDQEEGAESCYKSLEQRENKSIPSDILKKLILLVLKCNVFRFMNKFYSQTKGTCMGTPMAPNYANLFMNDFEQDLMSEYQKKKGISPFVWWRCKLFFRQRT